MASVASAIPYEGTSDDEAKPAGASLTAKSRSVLDWMGSAPHPVMRMHERSSPATSLSLRRLATRAKAKFGAYVIVPRCLWIVSSQMRGERTKLAVGKKTTG